MNILYINHYAGSAKHGMEFRPYYLAREWVKAGHSVQIVAANFSHLRQLNPDCAQNFSTENLDGINYIWCKTLKYQGNGVWRFINIFSFLFQLYRLSSRYKKNWRPDVVIASSTYPLDIFPAKRIARISGATLVYEVHDLWPLTLIEVGKMSPRHPFIRLLQWAENYAYCHADKVISLLPSAKQHMLQHGMSVEKYNVIPNGIVVSEWQSASEALPELHAKQIADLKSAQRFLIGYAGGHGLANALQDLIHAAALLGNLPISLILVGEGSEKIALQNQAKALSLTNVVFLPAIGKAAIPQLLRQMDALYLGWRNLPIYRFGLNPNKLFDYLMSARPVLHAVALGNDMVAEAGAGISVAAEDPAAIAAGLRKLYELSPEARRKMGESGQQYVLANHDYAMLAKRFISALSSTGASK